MCDSDSKFMFVHGRFEFFSAIKLQGRKSNGGGFIQYWEGVKVYLPPVHPVRVLRSNGDIISMLDARSHGKRPSDKVFGFWGC